VPDTRFNLQIKRALRFKRNYEFALMLPLVANVWFGVGGLVGGMVVSCAGLWGVVSGG